MKHKERSKRSHFKKEAAKNWFFTCCGKYTYAVSVRKGAN